MMAPMSDDSPPNGPTAAADAVSPHVSGHLGDSGPRGDPGLPRPDPILGFYGPGTAVWRVNREAVLLGAGPAALLLQIAHPHVAEGVAQHSDFQSDPWRRLRRTLRTTLAMVFGDGPTAERAVRRLNGVHATVRGEAIDPDARTLAGTTYRAMDPDLLLWVQVTLVWTSVQAYERWVGHLDAADREELWAEAREVGRRLGISLEASLPDWPALEAYWQRMTAPDGPIAITPTARRLAASIVRPPIPGLPAPIVDLLATPGLGSAPGADPLGLRHPLGAAARSGRERRRCRASRVGDVDAAGLALDAPGARRRPARPRCEAARHRVGTIHRTRPRGADCPCLARISRVAPSSPASGP